MDNDTFHTAGGGLCDALGGDLGLVRDGNLRLSPAHTLPSVARSWLEDLAARLGLGVTHAELTLTGLTGADEAFVAGMPFCVLPVAAVGDERPAAGAPGPVTARLLAAWSEEAGIDIAAQTAALADAIPAVH